MTFRGSILGFEVKTSKTIFRVHKIGVSDNEWRDRHD